MRPRFVLLVMLIALAFFLILMMSPGFWHRKALGIALVARYQNPTAENVQAVELEKAKARREQYIVCSLAALNVIAIIIYGTVQQRKRTV